MTLAEILSDLYVPLRGISPRTQVLYGYTLEAWGRQIGRQPTLDDLDEISVARFLAARAREKSPATVAKDRAQIVALWSFCAKRGLVSVWPDVRRINVPERVPEAWTADEFRRLLAAASLETVTIAGIQADKYWRALLLVCYDTAERITGVMGLRWADVGGADVIFRAEVRKGGRRDICRPIGQSTVSALSAIREPRRDLVFPWDRCQAYLWGRMGIILRRAGLPDNRRSKFHRIRRTTASFYAAAGHSATDLLDHSSPAVTRRYLDPRIVRAVAAPDVLPRVW
ncbi:MAG: tyrosine-type recombinase/integrase [Ilumatobacteraceae bacterium]